MLVLNVLILIVLLGVLYVVYEALRRSQEHDARFIANIAGGVFAVVSCLLVLVVRPMVFDSAIIPSDSMAPTLQVGDRMFTNKLVYKHQDPKYGEIITFRFPARPPDTGEEILIKRVMGLPEDVMEVKYGAVYRNGQRLSEPYIKQPITYQMPPVKVPHGALFVMGDNRNTSDDSHIWGPLDRRRVTGRAAIRIWPLSRFGSIH
jgi:signal peptidase I